MTLRLQQRGIALVIVLWIVALLSVIAASLAYSMRTETALATHTVERAQARALAEAGVMYAIVQVLNRTDTAKWPMDGSEREWRFGPGIVRIRTIETAGMIDLNFANRGLLEGLLVSAGTVEEERTALLDAIEDWRDRDNLRHLHGAEADDYRAAGRALGPKNAPFESVEELQQVLGMTPQLYRKIAPALTVFSNREAINPTFAPPEVLGGVPGLDPETVAQYVAMREQNAIQGQPPSPLPVEAEAADYISYNSVGAYHISAQGLLDTGAQATVEAVITRGGMTNQPFTLLSWRENK